MPFSKNDNFPVWLKYVVSPQFSTFDFQTKTIAIKKLFIKTSKKIPTASGNTIIYCIQIIFLFFATFTLHHGRGEPCGIWGKVAVRDPVPFPTGGACCHGSGLAFASKVKK